MIINRFCFLNISNLYLHKIQDNLFNMLWKIKPRTSN